MPIEVGPGDQHLESGRTYKFANVKTGSALTIHPATLRVLGNHYIGSPLQLWEVASRNGLWTFKNNETGLYLGFDVGVVANNGKDVTATANAFTWAVMRDEKGWSKLFIPYTKQSLDLDDHGGWGNGIGIHSYVAIDNLCQKWVIDPDTSFEAPVASGELYKLLNPASGTVAHLEEPSNEVSGFRYNEGRNQKWEVLSSGSGTWFIKSHYNGLYIGIKDNVAEKGARVVGTEGPFAWDIAPKYREGRRKPNGTILYVPNTELAFNLKSGNASPGTEIQLWTDPNSWPKQYWVFEKVECLTQCQEHLQIFKHSIHLLHEGDNGAESRGKEETKD
ncbi:hypothetical protein DFP72DRAFT_407121 [Ephemerocybe angulata]|uniref:Ricin B lectin domain-containing protein n=1 Tax=Ephemerocybe angulata TaxID=980116 RepID=A0A8H6HXA6_9AGAR|nr:hypothetical protein DFP72DRAFT_407121 [Tulosesus angulatus]